MPAISWDEASRIIDAADKAQRESRARVRVLRPQLAYLGRPGLRGADFHQAAAAHVPLPRLPYSPYVHEDKADSLFAIAKVREAVGRELGRVERSKLRAYVGQVADELQRARVHSSGLPGYVWDDEAGRKLRECSDPEHMQIGVHYHPEGDGLAMVKVQRRRCWLRICPRCSQDHASRLRMRYEGRIQTVLASRVPSCSLKHLVLTLPRSADLRADLTNLHRWAKKLIKHYWGAHGQGAFATAEVGPRGGNVHVHAIVYGRYVRQADISDKWRQLTGDRGYVVWVKRITPSQAVREGLKYITKLGKRDDDGQMVITPADLAELHMAIKGKRRVWAWGCFYGLADQDADKEPVASETDDEDAPGDKCKCGAPMLFISVHQARALIALHSKGATNCAPSHGAGPHHGAGISPPTGPPS
jgi:hypothetical protein